jgi:hypothetical protein
MWPSSRPLRTISRRPRVRDRPPVPLLHPWKGSRDVRTTPNAAARPSATVPRLWWIRALSPVRCAIRSSGLRRFQRRRLRMCPRPPQGSEPSKVAPELRHGYGIDGLARLRHESKVPANRLFPASVDVAPRNEGVPGSSPGVGLKALQIDQTNLRLMGYPTTSPLVKKAYRRSRKSLQIGVSDRPEGRDTLAHIRHRYGNSRGVQPAVSSVA